MALIPWYRWLILEFFSERETFIDDVPIMGDVDDMMEVDYADSMEATTLVMGGGDVAIMADVEDMQESTVGMRTNI